MLKQADAKSAAEKRLKTEIKEAEDALHEETRCVIQALTDEEVRILLHEKWAAPIETGIQELPKELLGQFTKEIEALSKKYAVTMSALDAEIRETERELAAMLGELTGSEADMAGIEELRKLLGEDIHG